MSGPPETAPAVGAEAQAAREPALVIAVYVMADGPRGAVRVGLTTDLASHVRQHQEGAARRLGVVDDRRRLVWYERHQRLTTAVTREQAIQAWRPEWIAGLVETANPEWLDLATTVSDPPDAEIVLI